MQRSTNSTFAVAMTAALAALTTWTESPHAQQPPAASAGPVFTDGQAQIVPEFHNSADWIRETLWVETEFDSDRNGRRDRVFVDVTRQRQTETGGLKVAGRFYDVTFDLQPDDQVIPAGRRIGLMIFSSDRDFTLWPAPGTELTIDVDRTLIDLPVVGGRTSLERAGIRQARSRQEPSETLRRRRCYVAVR